MKMRYAAVVSCLIGWKAAAATVEVRGPVCDLNAKVVHTTYYYCNPNNSYHGALDISNGTCNTWQLRGMLVGNFYWNVVSQYTNCLNTPQTPSNYVYVNGTNGYRFYQYHHNHNSYSYSRSCDRCVLGLVGATGQAYGAHVHAQHNQYSTVLNSWHLGYVTCGSSANCNDILGYVQM